MCYCEARFQSDYRYQTAIENQSNTDALELNYHVDSKEKDTELF